MPHLLPQTPEIESIHFGSHVWNVHGVQFKNSAVQFWSNLVDELIYDFPLTSEVIFKSTSGVQLNRQMRYPENDAGWSLERLNETPVRQAWDEILAEIDLFGVPGPVMLEIPKSQNHDLIQYPLDTVDSDIFLFLLAWILEWSHIPEALWNDERITGAFWAEDRERRWVYRFALQFDTQDIHEGLFQRTLHLQYDRIRL